jgi:hypothetical protein
MRIRAWGLTLLALGAAECGGTTGGHLIQMPLQAGGIARDASQPFTFVTGQGWNVTLTQAEVVLGPLYFNIDAPSSASFRSGVVIVQATEQFIVDMLDPTLQNVPGGADGETGTAVSVEIGFYTTVNMYNDMALVSPDGGAMKTLPAPLAANGQQGTAYLAGRATNKGAVVDFAGRVQITGALVTQGTPIDFLATLSGACAGVNPLIPPKCNLEFTTTSGPLQLRVDPKTWFDQADFCNIVRPPPVRVAGDGGVSDGGASDAGPSAVSAGDGGVDAGPPIVGAPCAPAAGTVYDWADTNPFNSAVLVGMKNSNGVYQFSLGGP